MAVWSHLAGLACYSYEPFGMEPPYLRAMQLTLPDAGRSHWAIIQPASEEVQHDGVLLGVPQNWR